MYVFRLDLANIVLRIKYCYNDFPKGKMVWIQTEINP